MAVHVHSFDSATDTPGPFGYVIMTEDLLPLLEGSGIIPDIIVPTGTTLLNVVLTDAAVDMTALDTTLGCGSTYQFQTNKIAISMVDLSLTSNLRYGIAGATGTEVVPVTWEYEASPSPSYDGGVYLGCGCGVGGGEGVSDVPSFPTLSQSWLISIQANKIVAPEGTNCLAYSVSGTVTVTTDQVVTPPGPSTCPPGYTLTGTGVSPVIIPYTVRSAAGDEGIPLTVQDLLVSDGTGALPAPYTSIGMPNGATVQVADLLATTASRIVLTVGGALHVIRADAGFYIAFPEATPYVGSTVVFSGDAALELAGPSFTAYSETYTFNVVIPGGGSYCAPDDVEPAPNPRTITLRTQELRFYNSYALIPPGETVLPPQTGGPTPV